MFLVSKTTRYRSFLALLGFVGSKAAVCLRRKLSAREAMMLFCWADFGSILYTASLYRITMSENRQFAIIFIACFLILNQYSMIS